MTPPVAESEIEARLHDILGVFDVNRVDTISKEERVVAALSKQGILPSTFEVDTADGEDDLFLLCLVLAIEQIHRERKRR